MNRISSHGWPPSSIRQRLLAHNGLICLLRELPSDTDDGVNQALSRFLVVRSCGLIESIRDDAADLYCKRIGPVRLHSRIRSALRNGLGVRPSQLLDFVATFDKSWRLELEVFLQDDDGRRANALGAMVDARKKIAHGDGEQVTVRKALQWADVATEVAKWHVQKFDPTL